MDQGVHETRKTREFTCKILQIILRNRIEIGLISPVRLRTKSEILPLKLKEKLNEKELKEKLNEKELKEKLNEKEFCRRVLQSSLHARTNSDPESYAQKSLDLEAELDFEFFKNMVPIHFDVCSGKDQHLLLERWVLSFKPYSHSSSQQERDHVEQNDVTDLILLTQSLYSQTRCLPLGSALIEKTIPKSELKYGISLANGQILSHSSPFQSKCILTKEKSFHPNAQLSVYNFKTSSGPFGSLILNVVYDSKLTGLSAPLPFKEPEQQSTKDANPNLIVLINSLQSQNAENQKHFPSIISSGTFVTSPTSPSSAPNDFESMQNNARIAQNHSPLPSPKMQKRVVAIAQSRIEKPASNKERVTSLISPTRTRSNLQFTFSMVSSSSSDNLEDYEDYQQQIISKNLTTMLTPDGNEIEKGSEEEYERSEAFISNPPKANFTRRDSIASNSSELYGSFVGSYEESILIGRMSTTPSKPINFLAEIGVLAIGKCKPSLKCPAHLSISFPAYFYQISDEDVPTPYVGTIELYRDRKNLATIPECVGYKLPSKGQLQILIKNPSCTAIKVFLIPYDFRDMPARSKTFIRQKSYAIRSKSTTAPSSSSILKNRRLSPLEPIMTLDRLKFAVHLHFQTNSKRQLYLTFPIRVVFSPRPLESDETLKIVYQGPDFPKYQEMDQSLQQSLPTPVATTVQTVPPLVDEKGR